jgi:transglutaminase-like putative cysteine protease
VSFLSIYRLSFYLMLFLATLTMSADATDSKIAMLFPIAVAAASFLAFFTVDRHPRLGISRNLANALGMASIGLIYLEYQSEQDQLLLALAHWLVYLQLIKMFLPKQIEDDWFLFLLGLMQVLVGTVISQSDREGMILLAWAILALWVLALFSLHRDALRFQAAPRSPGVPRAEPYPGLLDLAFLLSAVRVMALTLALGGVIFLAMPRYQSVARSQTGTSVPKHLTGFDDEVQLGQLGEILENDNVVLTVELEDNNGARIEPPSEPLWRGVTMAQYENGRWHRQGRDTASFPIITSDLNQRRLITQKIKLEANDTAVLFGLRPMLEASANRRFGPDLNSIDGTIFRSDVRPGTFDYRVLSDTDQSLPQPGESAPGSGRPNSLLAVPEDLKPRLAEIADGLVRDIPPDDIIRRARALEAYLRDSGRFSYSLKLDVVDASIDPVLDFIVNRKEGHCEYFASALALMLRSIGIPARLVNGFKGGDWNEIAQILYVRQKHAHSWVEALVEVKSNGPSRTPVWITLDPTPGNERDLSVAQVGGFRSNFRQLSDLIRYIWVFYVVGYNPERQDRLVYAPIRRLSEEARRGFRMMGQAAGTVLKLFHFPNAESFVSVRGFLVSFVGLSLVVGLISVSLRVWRRIQRWYRGDTPDSAALAAGVVFYRRLASLLAEIGLERSSAETQQEFALQASTLLTRRGPSTEAVADVPVQVVEAFYRVRFGDLDLPPATLKDLEARLDALESSLHTAAT